MPFFFVLTPLFSFRKVSRREFIRHSDAWSEAVLEAELLYSASLEAGGVCDDEGRGVHEQQQRRQATSSVENHAGLGGTTRIEVSAANGGQDKQACGNNGGPNLGGSGSNSREDQVGAFLRRRVREILRANPGSGGQGEGEGEGDVDEGILGYLMRKQYAVEGCDDLDSVSVAGYGMYKELEGGDVRIPGGFSRVVEAIAAKVRRFWLGRCAVLNDSLMRFRVAEETDGRATDSKHFLRLETF